MTPDGSPPLVPADDPRLLGLRQILGLMDALRAPDGCPWDRAQTPESLRPFLLEETYELLEALDEGEPRAITEELGDVLFQVVFHARIAEDEGQSDLGQVASGIAHKLYRRHPHVFGDVDLDDPRAVEVEWEALKLKEKQERTSVLDGIPKALPGLLRAERLQDKAARVGFDWDDAEGPLEKLAEELEELAEAREEGDQAAVARELGDLLFTVVNLARHLKVPAEDALREAAARFEGRFRVLEKKAGPGLKAMPLEEKERLWQEAKQSGAGD